MRRISWDNPFFNIRADKSAGVIPAKAKIILVIIIGSKREKLRYQRNLIGSPDAISERIRAYQKAGVTTLAGMLFVASTVAEMQEGIELFWREVLPNFR